MRSECTEQKNTLSTSHYRKECSYIE
jgi:hypothetical protein